jgi:hypothetical protein
MVFKQITFASFTWWFSSLIFSSSTFANFQSDDKILNGTALPTTNMSYLWLFSQKLYLPDSQDTENNQMLKTASGFTLNLEIPVAKYFASGFYFQFYRGLQQPGKEDDPYFVNLTEQVSSFLGYNSAGFGMFLKPKVEIPIFFGSLALSFNIPLGFELPIGIPLFSFASDQKPVPFPCTGYGLRTGISLGLEYFPVYILGLFIEAGYQASYHNFLLLKLNGSELTRVNGTFHYLIHGGALMAGIKLAY